MQVTGKTEPHFHGSVARKPGMTKSPLMCAFAITLGLPAAALAENGPLTCTLQYTSYGEERNMRLVFSDETNAALEFLTGDGTWQEDPDLGPLSCEVENTCRGQSAKDVAERGGTPVGVTIALDRTVGYAAYAEWRVVNDEVLQWAFLTRLTCD